MSLEGVGVIVHDVGWTVAGAHCILHDVVDSFTVPVPVRYSQGFRLYPWYSCTFQKCSMIME